ncbi:glycosyltransferase family 87 protein [uncultured Arthrobacter sp.]|uniref:glycosyltransferase family 87 protein n=1 Tax=uncultured Arthrobacter sp. TaxID=114050 RepID=UPI003217B892
MGKVSHTGAAITGPTTKERFDFAKQFPLATRAAVVLTWALGLLSIYVSIRGIALGSLGQDSHAYWLAAQGEQVYGRAPGRQDAYLYSPIFLAVVRPLALLPWPPFLALWIFLEAAVLLWLVKPLRTRWAVPIFLLCVPEIVVGNIYILLAGAAVIGLRRPAAWAFPILTKVTVGVGLLWFAVRGDWRRLLQGLAGVALVVAVSYALEPGLWNEWIRFLIENKDGTPDSRSSFMLRCVMAVLLVVVGARKQWPWLVPPAMVLASPVLVGLIPLTMLAAIPRLAGRGAKDGFFIRGQARLRKAR